MIDDARGKRYAAARARTGLSQRALAGRLRVTAQAISKWESGESEPTTANARALADLSGMSLEWLLTGKGQNGSAAARSNVAPYNGRGRLVPEVGDTVQGAYPASKQRPQRFVQTYFQCSSASVAYTVAGDSMAPEFVEGDVIVVDPSITPAPGDYVFVEVGATKLFRRYRPQTAGCYDLVPVNPDWPTEHITPERNAVVKGVMVEHASPRRKG